MTPPEKRCTRFIVKKLPGRPKKGEVTLTRGLTHEGSFDD